MAASDTEPWRADFMATVDSVFVTRIYRAALDELGAAPAAAELAETCRQLAADDDAGRRWCRKNGYPGYTSYASLNDLPWRFPAFRQLAKALDRHVAAFARELEYDLGRRKLVLDSLWANVLTEGGAHTSHIHPNSVISGTFYAAMPEGASALKFEDPRHAMMMATPPRKAKARADNRSFLYYAPAAGELLLWESFLRHEVPLNRSADERITISFNYRHG
jgi:uncharacterized protein (TIGR02466 family)